MPFPEKFIIEALTEFPRLGPGSAASTLTVTLLLTVNRRSFLRSISWVIDKIKNNL